MAVCINGAYANTDVAARSLEEVEEAEAERVRKEQELLEAREKMDKELAEMRAYLETLKK